MNERTRVAKPRARTQGAPIKGMEPHITPATARTHLPHAVGTDHPALGVALRGSVEEHVPQAAVGRAHRELEVRRALPGQGPGEHLPHVRVVLLHHHLRG